MTDEEIFDLCALDPWFINQLRQLVEIELDLKKNKLEKAQCRTDEDRERGWL